MLVLSRRVNEWIAVGDGVLVKVIAVTPTRVKLGFVAPAETKILRAELAREPWEGGWDAQHRRPDLADFM